MWNIIEYNQIARGEGVRLFTACGIFEGVYRGSEAVDESQPEQWVVLSDVTFSPHPGRRGRSGADPYERRQRPALPDHRTGPGQWMSYPAGK